MRYVLDIVEYVWNHPKKDKAFPGWSKDQLAVCFRDAFRNQLASWSETPDGKINGVVLTKLVEDKLHIVGILCDERQVIKGFLDKYREFYDGKQITGRRNGTIKVYPRKIINKLYGCKH